MKQKIVVVHSTVCLKSNGGHVTEGSLKPLRNLTKWGVNFFEALLSCEHTMGLRDVFHFTL